MGCSTKAAVKVKQAEAMRLLSQGKSYDEIAAILGYASRSSAWRLVNKALSETVVEEVKLWRELSAARLEELIRLHWDRAARGDYRAARIVLAAIRAEGALYGLDRPAREGTNRGSDRPWGIVFTDEERQAWEAAGSPREWHR